MPELHKILLSVNYKLKENVNPDIFPSIMPKKEKNTPELPENGSFLEMATVLSPKVAMSLANLTLKQLNANDVS